MRFLNFGEEPVNEDDRLGKIRFLINHLNTIVLEIFTPQKEVSLDGSMMLWRGRLVLCQYIKNKDKYGIQDGFVLKSNQVKNFKTHSPLGKQEL